MPQKIQLAEKSNIPTQKNALNNFVNLFEIQALERLKALQLEVEWKETPPRIMANVSPEVDIEQFPNGTVAIIWTKKSELHPNRNLALRVTNNNGNAQHLWIVTNQDTKPCVVTVSTLGEVPTVDTNFESVFQTILAVNSTLEALENKINPYLSSDS